MILPHGTVIAVIDGKTWNLFRNAGDEAEPELTALETPALVESNHGSGGRHGSSSGNPSGSQLDEDAHAAAVAGWLNREVTAHKIDHLVVIAAPRTLGELRHHWTKGLEQVLLGEFPKDLVGHPPADILASLRAKNE